MSVCFVDRSSRCPSWLVLITAATLIAFLLQDATRAQAPAHLQAAIQRIDALAAAELAKDNVASVTVGVVSGSALAWTKSYGLADMEKKIARGARHRLPNRLDHQAVYCADAAAVGPGRKAATLGSGREVLPRNQQGARSVRTGASDHAGANWRP